MNVARPPPQARGSFQADLRRGGIRPWGNASWTVSKLGNGHHLTIGDVLAEDAGAVFDRAACEAHLAATYGGNPETLKTGRTRGAGV